MQATMPNSTLPGPTHCLIAFAQRGQTGATHGQAAASE